MPENGPDAQYFQEDWCSREANINLVLILCMDINNNNNAGNKTTNAFYKLMANWNFLCTFFLGLS